MEGKWLYLWCLVLAGGIFHFSRLESSSWARLRSGGGSFLVIQDREQQEACHILGVAREGREMELPSGRFVKALPWSLLTEVITTLAPFRSANCSGVRKTDGSRLTGHADVIGHW